MAKEDKALAKKYCANFGQGSDYGICLGAMMYRRGEHLITLLDKDYAGKECVVGNEKCSYFESTVKPIVQ